MEEFHKICKAHDELSKINDTVSDAKINLDKVFASYTQKRMIKTIQILLSKITPDPNQAGIKRLNNNKEFDMISIESILEWCCYDDLVQIIKLLLAGEHDTNPAKKYSKTLALLKKYAHYFSHESYERKRFELNRAIVTGDVDSATHIIKAKKYWLASEAINVINSAIREHQNAIFKLFLIKYEGMHAYDDESACAPTCDDQILKYITGNKILQTAIMFENYGAVCALSGLTINLNYDSCIIVAIRVGNIEIVKFLIDQAGTKVRAMSADPKGRPTKNSQPAALDAYQKWAKKRRMALRGEQPDLNGKETNDILRDEWQKYKGVNAAATDRIGTTKAVMLASNKRFLLEAAKSGNNCIIKMFLDKTKIDMDLMKQLIKNNNVSMIQEIFREYPKESQQMFSSGNVTKLFDSIVDDDQTAIVNLFIERMDAMPILIVNHLIKGNLVNLIGIVLQKFPTCITNMLIMMKQCHIRNIMEEILLDEYFDVISLLLKNGLKVMPYLIILIIKFGHHELLRDMLNNYPCPKRIMQECAKYFSFDDAVFVAAKEGHIEMLKLLLDYDIKFNDNVLATLVNDNNVEIIEIVLRKFPNIVINKTIKSIIMHKQNRDILTLFSASNGNNYEKILSEAILHNQSCVVAILMEQKTNSSVIEDIFCSREYVHKIRELFQLPNERKHYERNESDSETHSESNSEENNEAYTEENSEAYTEENSEECYNVEGSDEESEEVMPTRAKEKDEYDYCAEYHMHKEEGSHESPKNKRASTLFNAKMKEMRAHITSNILNARNARNAQSAHAHAKDLCLRDDNDDNVDDEDQIFRLLTNEWVHDFDYYDQNEITCEKDFQFKYKQKSCSAIGERKEVMHIIHLLLENGADIKYLPVSLLKKFSKYVSSDEKDFAEVLFSQLNGEDYGKMFNDGQMERLNMIPTKSAANI